MGKNISEFFEGVSEGFKNILDFLNPVSENFFGNALIEGFKKLLRSLFEPSEERITAIKNIVENKFDFIFSIKTAINSLEDMFNNIGNAPKFTLSLGATKYTVAQDYTIIDLSWYAPYKQYGDLILTGFIYLFFLWRLFINVPSIINGIGGAIQSDYMVSDIQAYSKFGIGRSSSLTTYQDKNGGVYRK